MKQNTFQRKTAKRVKELELKYGAEDVFVVPYAQTAIINDLFMPWDAKTSPKLIYNDILPYGRFIRRADAEEDMSYEQIIPYVLVKSESNEYYVTKRIDGEQRLKNKLSLGFGGHINSCDDKHYGVQKMVYNCMNRELSEEAKMPRFYKTYEIGTVRDLNSSTPDHIGIVFCAEVAEKDMKKVKVLETDKLKGSWMSLKDLVFNFESFESWAQLIIAEICTKK